MLPWVFTAIFAAVSIALVAKVKMLQKNVDKICSDFTEHLSADTNTLISVSCRDKHVRRLAAEINVQLRELRKQQIKYLSGDRELKSAVTNISHDLRTPLTAICGYLDLLEREQTDVKVTRYVSMIRNRTEAMKTMTEELFRYSVINSVEEMKLEQISVTKVLEECLASHYAAITQRGLVPTVEICDNPVMRSLDKNALMRIFGNIVGNALKYSDGDLSVKLSSDGKVVFSNTARSLSKVETAKLFDRFYTVESARNSTGLGLSIAKLLTERMGGTISADYRGEKLSIIISFCNE